MNQNIDEIIEHFLVNNPKVSRSDIHYRRFERHCLEWICPHGIGHPFWDAQNNYIHGCDGCCKNINIKPTAEKYKIML